jgi:hypothetical protein
MGYPGALALRVMPCLVIDINHRDSTRSDCEHNRGKDDHVDGKNEHGWVPDMVQQAETGNNQPQPDRGDSGGK